VAGAARGDAALPPGTVLGQRVDEVPWVPEGDPSCVRAIMRDLSRGSHPVNVRELPTKVRAYRNVRKDGSILLCEWYNSALHDADGKVASVLSLVLDVTERERAQEALRASEEKLRLAQDAAGIGSWDWNLVTGEIVYSDRCKALMGLPPDANVDYERGLHCIQPEDRERIDRAVRDALASRTDFNAEMRVRWPDGTMRWVASRGRGFYDAYGDAVRMAGMTLDITERKLAEQALQEQLALKDQFARVAQSVPGLICSFRLRPDGTACMPFTTAAAEDMFGISPAVLAKDFSPAMAKVHPDDVGRLTDLIAESARTMARFHHEFRYLHPRQGLRWREVWSVPMREPDGSTLWDGYVMDVTERNRAEEAIREANRLKTEFLGVLSHELRNPLAPIRNSIYLLDRAPRDGDLAQRAKDVIRRQTDHLTRLVDDLLDVTRISRGKIELERERIDLREIVARTCDDHRGLFEGRKIELRLEQCGPVWVDADATRIAQVGGNLLQNAAKFSREGGTVTVGLCLVNGDAELRVRDDGMGIPADLLPRIFEPFVQAASGLARTKGGLGLGLALVKGIVELHGGSVRASSEGTGRGSELVITLPSTPQARPSVPASAAHLPTRSIEILVVEDNVDAAQTIAEVLRMEGHRVHIATDGLSGIMRARELKPEVVVCDIGLPDMDGYEVARELRRDAALRSTRLIALSGYAQPEDRERAREAGFEAHLGKPAPLDELKKIVEAGRPRRT